MGRSRIFFNDVCQKALYSISFDLLRKKHEKGKDDVSEVRLVWKVKEIEKFLTMIGERSEFFFLLKKRGKGKVDIFLKCNLKTFSFKRSIFMLKF